MFFCLCHTCRADLERLSDWHHHAPRDDRTQVTCLVFGHLWLKLLRGLLGPVKTKSRDTLSLKSLILRAPCLAALPGP